MFLALLAFLGWGGYSVTRLAIDALPDITTNQVQVITVSPSLATQEVEQLITYPLEMQMKTIADETELRSVSRSGLSVITIVFNDKVPLNIARQRVAERLKLAETDLPAGVGVPEMIPPTTGLGEIYQYTLAPKKGYEEKFSPMELRTVQDWIVKRQLLGTPGVVDVSSFGGYLKQYEVAVHPEKLVSMKISLTEVFTALEKNNQNTGGSYIEKGANIYFIRGEGLVHTLEDIQNIVVKTVNGIPVKVRDLGDVNFGYAARYGAMTRNGKGEAVGGIVLMMKGANSVDVIKAVKKRVAEIEKNLPEGLAIDVFIDRTKLINKTIGTVTRNLTEGALIVIFVLVLMLGNFRAGLIVASVIPLAMLFAITLMNLFGLSANLMSMGALDFGLIVDGAVIVVESLLHTFSGNYRNTTLTQSEMDEQVIKNASGIMNSAAFGQIIILIVYLPIFALVGVEGKMFKPMAQTVGFAIVGALLLSITYVPFMSALFLKKKISDRKSIADRFIEAIRKRYIPLLEAALRRRAIVITTAVLLFVAAVLLFTRLGGEFIPEMDEGDFATNFTIRQGSNLSQTIRTGTQLEKLLLQNFPEVKEVVSKIGTSEVPTDPMPMESADLIIVMKDKSEWSSAETKDEMAEKMNEKLSEIPGITLSFEQPIQMRFNELIAGVKSDIAIKIFGESPDVLFTEANRAAKLIAGVEGITDVKVEQITGLPQLVVNYNRARIAQYGLSIVDVNQVLSTALAGGKAGVVYEGERKFDLVVRLKNYRDADIEKVKNIYVPLPDGTQIPISQLASVTFKSAPSQISRDNAERRIVVEANVRGRDIESAVTDIQAKLNAGLKLPPGYFTTYGGTFQNLQEAKSRLLIAVPVALALILFLLFITFNSIKEALLIFSAIPLAAVGGVFALWLRSMNFSISAGIGFIALFGVAVLNGIVMISYFNKLEQEGEEDSVQRVIQGAGARLRPVLATATVASLGFLPMALSNSTGSEIQKPLATVVIGGLISSTLLTLIVLPVLYSMFSGGKNKIARPVTILLLLLSLGLYSNAQVSNQTLTLPRAIEIAMQNHPSLKNAALNVEQQQQLKKANFTLDPLNITYMGGEVSAVGKTDYNVAVTEGMKLPNVYVAQAHLQKEKIQSARQQETLTKSELVRNVSTAYFQVLYGQQNLVLLSKVDSIYTNFADYAGKKFKAGETAQLEKISAQARKREMMLKKQQAAADLAIYQSTLNEWLGTDTIYTIGQPDFKPLPPPAMDTGAVSSHPLLQWRAQQINIAMAEWKLEKNRFSPSLQFGYFNQSIERVNNAQGWIVGASIPLIKTGQGARTQFAKLNYQIAQNNLAQTRLEFTSAYKQAVQQFNKYNEALQYYQAEGVQLSTALFNTATKSYTAGEIGYTEYMHTITQAYQIENDYLQTVANYNHAVIQLNYLLNK